MVVLRSYFLKSLGRRFVSLHFEHSAMLRSLPFSYRVFITISPPHSGHSNFCVATVVREFLLAPAMTILQKKYSNMFKYYNKMRCLCQGYKNRFPYKNRLLLFFSGRFPSFRRQHRLHFGAGFPHFRVLRAPFLRGLKQSFIPLRNASGGAPILNAKLPGKISILQVPPDYGSL